MKKFKHIFSLLLCCSMAFGQETEPNNIDFFEGNTFVMDSITVDGVTNPDIGDKMFPHDRMFFTRRECYPTPCLYITITEYCNGCFGEAIVTDSFFGLTSGGGCTLAECDHEGDGYYYVRTSRLLGTTYYTINDNRNGYRMWSEANTDHVYYFSIDETMSTPNIGLEAFINISFNPNTKSIQIQNDQNTTLQKLSLTNILGKKVLEQSTDVNNIDVSALPNGVYVLLIESTKGVLSKKIMMH